MEEQKRLFIAIILSIVIIIGWNTFFTPPPPEPTAGDETAPAAQQDAPTASPGALVSDYEPESAAPADGSAMGTPAAAPSGEPETYRKITVSSFLYDLTLSEKNAAVTSLTLKDYRERSDADSPPKQLVSPELAAGLFEFDLEGGSVPGIGQAVFQASTDKDRITLNGGKETLTFTWTSPTGVVFEKVYTFQGDSYLIDLQVTIKNGSSMPIKDDIEFSIPGFIDEDSARFAFEGPVAYINGDLQEIKVKDIEDKNTYPGTIDWAGYTSRYFLSAIVPDTPVASTLLLSFKDGLATTRYLQPMERLDVGKQVTYGFDLYMGPKSLMVLRAYDNMLKKAVNFGWFDFLAKPCLMGMNYIYGVIPNYGVAIILLTIVIKLLFWPLGNKSYKSMSDMRRVQPLMMEIREKYKHDKQKMNAEVMNLYKTYKVNPMSGCLPMLVQMPIFFALYRMLYQSIELRHAPFIGWIKDLSAPDRLFHFDVAIPFMQAPYGIPVLTIIMGATMFLQQKMSPTTGDPTQAKMMMLMPLFMTVIFINFPAGLVLYWLVNNVLSIGQQYFIQKKYA